MAIRTRLASSSFSTCAVTTVPGCKATSSVAACAVVVGIDGSDSALQAARWAGTAAAASGAPLHILHAMPSLGRNVTETAVAIQAAIMSYQRDSALIFLRAAEEAVHADRPDADRVRVRFHRMTIPDPAIHARTGELQPGGFLLTEERPL